MDLTNPLSATVFITYLVHNIELHTPAALQSTLHHSVSKVPWALDITWNVQVYKLKNTKGKWPQT